MKYTHSFILMQFNGTDCGTQANHDDDDDEEEEEEGEEEEEVKMTMNMMITYTTRGLNKSSVHYDALN